MAKLTVVEGPERGSEFDLAIDEAGAGRQFVVGRDPRVEIPLDDRAVSREHCRIEAGPRGFRLVDLESRNRTIVNGDPVDQAWLRDGDRVTVGDTELRFEDDRPAVDMEGIQSTIIKTATRRPPEAVEILGGVSTPEKGSTTSDRSIARLRGILDISRGLAGAGPGTEVLGELLSELGRNVEASHAVLLRREKRGTWKACARSGQEAGAPPTRVSLTVVERAARDREAVLSTLTARDARFQDKASVILEDIRSAMAVPVGEGAGDEVPHVLYLDRRGDAEAFCDEDLDLLRAVADPLGAALSRLEERSRLEDENRSLLRSLTDSHRIIGESTAIREVLEFIERAAPTEMTVLVQGETGTGKELVASAIHYGSPRRRRPFVAINCAALPEHLVESELFGHEKGAFTGAVSRKKGRFELADTGTVLLDEIGELSLACQAKLLRLLEERELERVGGTRTIRIDVRIIAATNKDLLDAVRRGEFREDLYYRLGVLNVVLPPLRDRTEDIPLLAEHFLACVADGGRPKKLGARARKRLTEYSWPGNVRQLRNVIESSTVLGRGREIRPDDLVLPESAPRGEDSEWTPISLQELEKHHVLRVLEHTRGNKKRAAEILGIERCTLYSKLKSYDP